MSSYRRQMVLSSELKAVSAHGGSLSVGKRKSRRPVVTKRPMHVVLRSTMAKGNHSLLRKKNSHYLKALLPNLSRRWGVHIYEWSNNGNHIHLLCLSKTRTGFQNFLRVFSGKVAQEVTETQNGRPLGRRFWDFVAYSRIVEWGKGFLVAKRYVVQNQLEAAGVIPYQPRKRKPPRPMDGISLIKVSFFSF